MEFIMKIPERVFRTAKTPEQVAEEMRQAAAVFWVARGDVAPEAVSEITAPSPPEKEGTPLETAGSVGTELGPAKDFKAFLRSMPDVGDDADFERSVDYGRELPEREERRKVVPTPKVSS